MKRPAPVRLLFTIPLVVIVLFMAACVPMPIQAAPTAPIAVIGTAPSKVGPGSPSIVDMTTRTAGASPTVATWQYISGAEAFNSKLDARLLSIFDARGGGRHEPAALPATPGALLADGVSVIHGIVLATGSVVGSRFMQTTMNGGVRTARIDEITYEDLGTGVVSGSATLIHPAMTGTLRTILGEAIGHPPPTQPPAAVSDAELLTAVAFTSSGDLSVTVHRDPGTGADLPDTVTVVLNADATDDVISPAGQALRTAVIADAPFNAPSPAPGGLAHINCDLVACAALTYDDGPNAQTTRLLGILEKHKVFATFFQQGGYVRANPGVAKAVAAAGHTIANHTMSHPYLTKLAPASIQGEVRGAQDAIEKATGVVPAYMRPPYGASNTTVAASVGLPQIIWDVDSLDWQSKNKAVFLPRIMGLVKPGSVILLHDVHASTVDGQDQLITQLKGKGFYLVTLPQLFAGIELKAGASYKCRGAAPGCVAGR
ncbi:peptidoglycan/xylan/chitin deacetylase (PgdA/CDA1 family) [Pseudarthrobacter sp. PvP004]|uniref:polysaccharide deacetylase family protein n=1 Tax=Pseudarthrobacter sp. PvP004 TaxID=2817850 RepID=UPI002570A0CE|nr:polysaccharide deacetylase family protein [Pseudarthrobacter sp. PvP004]MBP2268497.1 peptidoglycan/xylan/chitin deacetylase (PgdA/CDA1 family) [Pseudarthrobacter sp. PvP004]